MSVLHRNRAAPEESTTTAAPEESAATAAPEESAATAPSPELAQPSATISSRPAAPTRSRAVPTRTSAAWLWICLGAVLLGVLIVFMLQNTGSVEVSFLWLHGSAPLAVALLIAAVGAALLTMMVGVARMTQLRRRLRQRH